MTAPGQLVLDLDQAPVDPLDDLDLAKAIDERRTWLTVVLSGPRPAPCQCIPGSLAFLDPEDGTARCLRCGRFPRLPGPSQNGAGCGLADGAPACAARGHG